MDLGCGAGDLARVLVRRECDVIGFDIDPKAVEQARMFCAHAGIADLDTVALDELLGDDRFDVIVLADVLQYLRKPVALLDRARDLLREGGYVVAMVPNAGHGARRLAMLDGNLETLESAGGESGHGYTVKAFDELFLSSGYRLDALQRTQQPIFSAASGGLDAADYD
ncbi:MAG: class I SAM-dependent methyltransferase, partial [Candidatus Eremiobacteraeota bacterium]|nr:class I SAM-dependent methyltransferase [Candidatus Eremiobacteraeota bacterium]